VNGVRLHQALTVVLEERFEELKDEMNEIVFCYPELHEAALLLQVSDQSQGEVPQRLLTANGFSR